MSATSATTNLPLRALRHALDRVERALRPTPSETGTSLDHDTVATCSTAVAAPSSDDLDSTTTRELLIPRATDEPAAARASRQAADYLERRRRKLSRQLEDR